MDTQEIEKLNTPYRTTTLLVSNDDCLRQVTLFLSPGHAIVLASSCRVLRRVLNEQTLNLLLRRHLPFGDKMSPELLKSAYAKFQEAAAEQSVHQMGALPSLHALDEIVFSVQLKDFCHKECEGLLPCHA